MSHLYSPKTFQHYFEFLLDPSEPSFTPTYLEVAVLVVEWILALEIV